MKNKIAIGLLLICTVGIAANPIIDGFRTISYGFLLGVRGRADEEIQRTNISIEELQNLMNDYSQAVRNGHLADICSAQAKQIKEQADQLSQQNRRIDELEKRLEELSRKVK